MNPFHSRIKEALFGVAVGDALGVPVEFSDRSSLAINPVTGMRGWGTHHQPPGTWSDDSSLTFCLAESLAEGFSPEGLAALLYGWDAIPAAWIDRLARVQDIEDLAERCAQGIQKAAGRL